MTPGRVGRAGLRGEALPALTTDLLCHQPDAIWGFANNELIVSGPNGTAGIFATYPSGHLDMVNGFFDQVWIGDMRGECRGTDLFWTTLLACSRISQYVGDPPPDLRTWWRVLYKAWSFPLNCWA